jgi:Leucine-rich repeat (LRR) protein
MLEDVSYSCLRELVGRCMVRVGKNGSTDKIKTCRLHDLVRDFCLFKAKQENFLHIINSLEASSLGRVRRLAIHLNKEADKFAPARDEREGHLRSLLYSASAEYCMAYRNEKVIGSLFNDFKFLRVLKIEGIRGESSLALPRTIGSLVHLKLLSLKNSFIKRLPSSVSNLMSLQTLDLRVHLDAFMMAIPNVTGKMKTLRHLYLPSTYKKVSGRFRLASLGNMQTLVNVSSHHCDLNDLATLTNLRKLSMKVVDLQNLEEVLKCTSIVSHRLRSLSVDSREKAALEGILSSCYHILKLRLIGPIRELPENLHMNHPNLAKIMLEGTDLKDNQMEILEKLPSLRMLYLGTDSAFKSWPGTMVCSREGFPRLEFLSLNSLSKLKEWKVEEGAMPRLGRLHIENCKDLVAVPDGIRYITNLQELSITRMHSEFCARLGVQGEDFYKIQHVPFVHMF